MEDIEPARHSPAASPSIGCGLALDDFGTGFGSFTYLKKLPITYLKIDVEFVRDLATTRPTAMCQGDRRAGPGLRLQTIAEGVEDQAPWILRAEGVDYAQGFHLGRPEWAYAK